MLPTGFFECENRNLSGANRQLMPGFSLSAQGQPQDIRVASRGRETGDTNGVVLLGV